jgi:hypothetical protein
MTCIFGDRKMPTDVTKSGFLTNFSQYEIFRSVYINACAFDIFWLLVGQFDEVRALPQWAFRVLPSILVSFQSYTFAGDCGGGNLEDIQWIHDLLLLPCAHYVRNFDGRTADGFMVVTAVNWLCQSPVCQSMLSPTTIVLAHLKNVYCY